jgi:hypothetical protein
MGGGGDSSNDGKEPFFVKDPRKAIRVFFDRFGEEPDYSFEEQTVNKQRSVMSGNVPVLRFLEGSQFFLDACPSF